MHEHYTTGHVSHYSVALTDSQQGACLISCSYLHSIQCCAQHTSSSCSHWHGPQWNALVAAPQHMKTREGHSSITSHISRPSGTGLHYVPCEFQALSSFDIQCTRPSNMSDMPVCCLQQPSSSCHQQTPLLLSYQRLEMINTAHSPITSLIMSDRLLWPVPPLPCPLVNT